MIINKDINIHSYTLLICLVFVFIGGCVSNTYNYYRIPKNKQIVVIPFVSTYNPHSENIHLKDINESGGFHIEKLLTNELASQLRQKEISDILVVESFSGSVSDKLKNAALIIRSKILRYRERKGGKYAVSQPASVKLQIEMIDPEHGGIISRYEYEETQQPLSENLFNLKKFFIRKGRWVKAFELASYGISEFVNKYTE